MKREILTIAIALAATVALAQSSEYVSGYTKSNGTYVQGHRRTVANNTPYDNYSTAPNINPYTGKRGAKHYDNVPPYNTNYASTPVHTGCAGHRKR
ncbi:MAG: hypothetical protein JST67_05295 [Bacteroidetes bacterium]|nr:hypothetical protein [Bacteroidota bacterium]